MKHEKEKYDPLSALNTRMIRLTEEVFEEQDELKEEVSEVEEQELHEHWLSTA